MPNGTAVDQAIIQALCALSRMLARGLPADPRVVPPLSSNLYVLPLDSTPVAIAAGLVYDVPFPAVPQGARGVIAQIGLNVTGGGAGFSAVTTQILINGIPAPIFRSGPLVGVVGVVTFPMALVWADLVAGDVAVVRFTNIDVGPQNIGARCVGWHWFPED